MKDKISALSEEDKALCIKKTYEYHYQSGEESRNTYKIIIPLILVIPVLIMIELFSSHSCTNEDMLDLSCYFNIMKVSVGIAALLLIAYSFHIIFGSSYYASHQSQRTENFFDSVARSNSNEMAHSEAISLIG